MTPLAPAVERHQSLKRLAQATYSIPGSRSSVRVLARFGVQSLPLSLKNRQRLYNFFSADTIPDWQVRCSVRLPSGKPVRLNLDLRDDLSRTWYFWGYTGYEQATVRLFSKLLRSKSCVIDVGANIGYYTVLAAGLLEGRGEIHAFEPSPQPFLWLFKNVELNAFTTVATNYAALAEEDGEQKLFLPSDGAGTNASLVEAFTAQDQFVMTRTIRLDSYCLEHVTRPVDLIKLDAEGAELVVLRGANSVIDQWKPDIICEVLKPFEKELDQYFSARAYRKFLITDNGLSERSQVVAHDHFRDYYFSRTPVLF